MDATEQYLAVLRRAAAGRESTLAELSEIDIAGRFSEPDIELFLAGLERGLFRVEFNYLWSLDARQATTWLVEGKPNARPCWELLPQAAAYVELVTRYAVPSVMVRFETPAAEHQLQLDLAVLTPTGSVVVLGEAKAKPSQLSDLLRRVPRYADRDPGVPPTTKRGGPNSAERDAWKLAHQLWATRAPWLWLIAAGDRRVFSVAYTKRLAFSAVDDLPPLVSQASGALPTETPAIRLPGVAQYR